MEEKILNVHETLDIQKELISAKIYHVILTAPSLIEQNKLIEKMHTEGWPVREVEKIPGVILFKEPHLYGVALYLLGQIFHGHRERAIEAFCHEMDHYNEARNYDPIESSLAISFGIDGATKLPDGQITFSDVNWVGFITYELPQHLHPEEMSTIHKTIAIAPANLSQWDKIKIKNTF